MRQGTAWNKELVRQAGTRVLREAVCLVLDDTVALHTVMEASDVSAGGETIMIVRLR